MKFLTRGLVAAGATALVMATAGCGTLIKTDQQTQALWYEDGEFQAQTFKGCIGNAVRERKGMGDTMYRYPLGDRTWSFTGRQGSDTGPIEIKTKDGQVMTVLGFLQFDLVDATAEKDAPPLPAPAPEPVPSTPAPNPSGSAAPPAPPAPTPTPAAPKTRTAEERCDALRTFHERIGLKYGAAFDANGKAPAGWDAFLNDYVAVPVNSVMDRGALQHNVRDLYANPASQAAFRLYVQQNLGPEIDKVLGIPGLIRVKLVSTETPQPDKDLVDSFKGVEKAKAEADAAKAKADADTVSQDSKNKLAKAKYQEVAECVKVLGPDACFRLELQKGPNPPQYIPQGSQIHVPAK